MSESGTPICDLIAKLLSTGLSPGDALDAARIIEGQPTSRRATLIETREKWRLKKARQRAAKGDKSPGDKSGVLSSSITKTQNHQKKVTDSECPHVPGDVWPDDFGDQFWDAFPKHRRAERAKVYAKLERLRRDGYVDHTKKRQRLTWAALLAGLTRYVDSEPGDYAKAPLAWLNAQYWLNEFNRKGASNGTKAAGAGGAARPDPVASAAARAFGVGRRDGPAPAPASSPQPAGGMGAARPRPAGDRKPPVEFDNGFER